MLLTRIRNATAPLLIGLIFVSVLGFGLIFALFQSLARAEQRLQGQVQLTSQMRDTAADLEARLAAAQELLAAQDARLLSYETLNATATDTLTRLERQAVDQGARLEGLEAISTAQGDRTAQLSSDAQALSAQVAAAQDRLAALGEAVSRTGADNDATTQAVAGLERAANDLGNRLQDLETAQALPFGERVRAALLNDPTMLFAAVDAYEQAQNGDLFAAYAADIQSDPFLPVLGNPAGDITLDEYFDYNCGYCRGAVEDVLTLVETDGNIRLILKDFPILSKASHDAAMVAMAAAQHVAYLDLHHAAMTFQGQITGDAMLALAVDLGANAEAVRETLVQQQVQLIANLDRTRTVSQAMGITGTPAFFIEDRLIRGAVSGAELAQVVAEVRAEREK